MSTKIFGSPRSLSHSSGPEEKGPFDPSPRSPGDSLLGLLALPWATLVTSRLRYLTEESALLVPASVILVVVEFFLFFILSFLLGFFLSFQLRLGQLNF